jgi:hypothetical protein
METWLIQRLLKDGYPRPAEWTLHGWYHKQEGCWMGPLAKKEVAALARTGRLRSSDQLMEVWKSGDAARRSYVTVAEALGKR